MLVYSPEGFTFPSLEGDAYLVSFLPSQQKGNWNFSLRPLCLCGKIKKKNNIEDNLYVEENKINRRSETASHIVSLVTDD